jgi:hypothetical protein
MKINSWIRLFVFALSCKVVFSSCNQSYGKNHYGGINDHQRSTIRVDRAENIGIEKIVSLANAFKSQLNPDQVAILQHPYSVTDAKRWSNLPQPFLHGDEKSNGLNFGSLTPGQTQYAKALLKEISGTGTDEGWDELQQLLNADDYLNKNGADQSYGAVNYYITFLGSPADTGVFEIKFDGHHLAFANTYKNGSLVGATPSFRGVEPFSTFQWDHKNNQPLQQEQAAFSAMLNALSGGQLAIAKLSATYSDLLVGPQKKEGVYPSSPSGIKCSALSGAQKSLVLNAIKTYVDDIDDADAALIMRKYSQELDNTYISYSGTTGLISQNDYVRIDGPSVWIEYSCQHGVVLPGTHPHSIWRDKTKDYGGN